MPPVSKAQQRAAGADKARCEAGEKPRNFSCKAAEEFAMAPGGIGKLPEHVKKSTRGSAPFSEQEISAGYRKVGRK